ncbi:MAG: hypothetical protein NDJ89_04305 [Oligoflexia bacterium]|nr:hypothetical protein [Oligoflexia bacterium]
MPPRIRCIPLTFALGATLLLQGCALLIGNIKPVEEKSRSYGVMDLAQAKPGEWKRLSPEKVAPETSSTEISDVAYQSKATSAIISLNSACRPGGPDSQADRRDLQTLTNLLFLGISDVTQRVESGIELQGSIPALQTILQGRINGEEMKLRTVVFRKDSCVFDLVYMSRPRNFEQHDGDFSHFIASLRVKE